MIIPLAKDLAGNTMRDVYTLNFTTEKGALLPSPSILETSPVDGSLDVPTNLNIVIIFSEEMNRNASQLAISSNPFIFGAFSWDSSSKIMTWNPDLDLQANTKYIVTVGTNATSKAGIKMKTAYSFAFTTSTVPDYTPPKITKTDPSNGATGVAITSRLSLLWSEWMDRPATESAFFSSPRIACSWSWTGSMQICTPDIGLKYDVHYTIVILSSARDLSGNEMKDYYTFSFATESIDVTPPAVLSTYPVNGTKDVNISSRIIVTFSEPMNATSVEAALSITPGFLTATEWNPSLTTITITAPLVNDTDYIIAISTKAKDAAGNSLVSKYLLFFSTQREGALSSSPSGEFMYVVFGILIVMILVLSIFAVILLRRKRKEEEKPLSLITEDAKEAPKEEEEVISRPTTSSDKARSLESSGEQISIQKPSSRDGPPKDEPRTVSESAQAAKNRPRNMGTGKRRRRSSDRE
jgi:hypothetical protein